LILIHPIKRTHVTYSPQLDHTFLEIDDKGGEISHKDIVGERYEKGKGSIKILKHTSRGSKLINNLLNLFVH
jgi:hypothetical protein